MDAMAGPPRSVVLQHETDHNAGHSHNDQDMPDPARKDQ
jgi:hypothetical protein